MEIWKDVKGYEGLYQVSNLGNVKSLERNVRNSKYGSERTVKERVLAAHDNGYGYLAVGLTKCGKTSRRYVHRMVAEAFVANPYNKKYINHLDYDRKNNRFTNLEWCTAQENTLYSAEHMRKPKSTTEKMHRPKVCRVATSTGHRYIGKRGKYYRVCIRAIGIDKQFTTLDKAIEYRDKILEEKEWQSRSYKRTKASVSFAV